MLPSLAFDLTRCLYAPPDPGPRGIDRVDMQFARYCLSDWKGESYAILPTPWGTRALDRKLGQKIADVVEAQWDSTSSAAGDTNFALLREAIMARRGGVIAHGVGRGHLTIIEKHIELVRKVGFHIGHSARRHIPKGTIYFNVGHFGLTLNRMVNWLERRPDVRMAVMLHDAIPITHPELVTRSGQRLYRRMIANACRHAGGFLTTTQAARNAVLHALSEQGYQQSNVYAAQLAVDDVFIRNEAPDMQLRAQPYFVFCSAIEQRKNLSIVLEAWEQRVALGGQAPMLVIVGRRTDKSDEILRPLNENASLRKCVIEVERLSNAGLATLFRNARALLSPSWYEGFGLPVAEALSSGTPVIASDIEAHREVGGPFPTYVSPDNCNGWVHAVVQHEVDSEMRRLSLRVGYKPRNWRTYFEEMTSFIEDLSRPASS